MPRSGPGPAIGLSHIKACPRVGVSKPATMRNSVDFPQPEAPIRQTNSPLCTLQMGIAQRFDALALQLELLAHAAQLEDGIGSVMQRSGLQRRRRSPSSITRRSEMKPATPMTIMPQITISVRDS